MPVPAVVTKVNRSFTNPLMMRLSASYRGLAVLHHKGRRSGKDYQVPLMVFGGKPTWYILLTYGPDRDWIKNLQAAGEGELVHRGRTTKVVNPRFASEDEALPHIAPFGKLWRRVMRAPDIYAVDRAD